MLSLSHVVVLCHVIILLGLGLLAGGQRQTGYSWRERMRQVQLLRSNQRRQQRIPAPTAAESIELRRQRILEEMMTPPITKEHIPQEQKKQSMEGKRLQKQRLRKQKTEERRLRKLKRKEQRQEKMRLKKRRPQKQRLGKQRLQKQKPQKQSQAAQNQRQEKRLKKQRLKKQRQENRRLRKQRLKEQILQEQILREQLPSELGHTFVDQFATNSGEPLGAFNPGKQLQPLQTSPREPIGGGLELGPVGGGHWLDSSLGQDQPIVDQLATNSGEPLGAIIPGEQLQPLQPSPWQPLDGGIELDPVGGGQWLDPSLGHGQPIVDELVTNTSEPLGAIQPLQPSPWEPLDGGIELGPVGGGQWLDQSLGVGLPVTEFKDVDLSSNAGQSSTGGIGQSVKQPSAGIQTVNGGVLPKTEIPRVSAFTSSIQTKTLHSQIFKMLSGLSSKLKTA